VPRPRRTQSSQLSSGQASYVIDRMLNDRRISQGEILRYVNEMQSEIDQLERRLQSLREAAGGGGAAAPAGGAAPRRRGRPPGSRNRRRGRPAGSGAGRAAAAGVSAGGAKRGRKPRQRAAITAEQLASRQLQGRYLGLIRQIPASKRSQYQKTAKDRGREAAIKEMQSALGK
jgi:hypothetical protein